MPNTKKQYAGGKRPGKTKRFFKALATGSTKTKVSVNNAASKKNKLHASEQKLKGIEGQVRRTQKAANTHAAAKAELKKVNEKISAMEFKFQQDRYNKITPTPYELGKYRNFKNQRFYYQQELKKTKAAYHEHVKSKILKGKAEIKVNKRKKTLKAYEKAAEKLTLQKFNKKRWVTGWDKKYKKASVADIHKFINVDSKLDSFKMISDSEGKPVKKLLKQFEFDDFMKHPARATEVIDSFPGVKEYSAKIGINIDRLHENQKAMLAHKMIEITKNPDMTERAMATEMVKSVVVTKFASPEIKVGLMGYAKAPEGLGNPAPRLYNPGESSTDGPNTISRVVTRNLGTPVPEYLEPRKEPEYLEPRKEPEYLEPRKEPEYLEPRKDVEYMEPNTTLRRNPEQSKYSENTINKIDIKPQKEEGVRKTTNELRAAHDYIKGLPDNSPEKAILAKEYNEKLKGFRNTFESFTRSAPIIGGVEPIPTLPANIQIYNTASPGPIYNTASAGPAKPEPIYNNPATLQELANKSVRATVRLS